MFGRYAITNENGTLLFEINENKELKIEIVELCMSLLPLSVEWERDSIKIRSNFFMVPEQIHECRMQWNHDHYELSGSFAMFGKVEGSTEVFCGKTKYDVMIEELQLRKSRKEVKRSDEEIHKEVSDLMAKMTLQEKIGQMSQSTGRNVAAIGAGGNQFISEEEAISGGMVGLVIAMTGPAIIYEQQKNAVENSRLGIPLLFCQDVIHGFETIFPIPLGWSCSFHPELVEKAMAITAKEATSQGINFAFSPMLDISRDPRWGRVAESNGEDPFLCSRMSEAHIRGFQGDDLYRKDTMIACMKHFIGYGAAEGGRDYNTTEISMSTLYNQYVRPFQAGIDMGCAAVMNSFNVLNGVPMVANKELCKDLLREKMHFNGMLISDFAAVDELMVHGVAQDSYEASIKAFEASLDIEMGVSNYHQHLENAVHNGDIQESKIDESVRRILTYKYKCGIMDDPYRYLQPEKNHILYCEEHIKAAYDLAAESIVLLKNNGILPLSVNNKVALIGPIANSVDLFGPWQFSKRERSTKTIKTAFEEVGFDVLYEKGCEIQGPLAMGIEKALQIGAKAEVIVLCLGESKIMSGEAASVQNIHLTESQVDLAKALKALNKPMVLILTNGRPLVLDWMDENMDAILETWFLGSAAAEVIVDTVIGKINPSGKLSMTFPKHHGQIPIYYNHLNTGRPYQEGIPNKFLSKYIDGPNDPLYPFGYGLSYTRFELSEILLEKETMGMDEKLSLSLRITNTGDRAGAEVIQLYCHDLVAQIARPIKELIGFIKVRLEPQERKSIVFTIHKGLLAYYNKNYEKILEEGRIKLFLGTSSQRDDTTEFEIKVVNSL